MLTPLDRWFPRIVLAAGVLLCCVSCPAEAEPARVDAGQVCAVNHALRGHWSPKMCATVADALNDTPDPRLFAAIAVNESGMNERAINALPKGVFDVGLMGIRCITRTWEEDTQDICLNGPARGLTVAKLLNPEVNIRTAAAVLASHGGSLTRYSGSTQERGYGSRIAVLVAALGGELRIPKRATGAKWARVKGLARRIVEAVTGERRS